MENMTEKNHLIDLWGISMKEFKNKKPSKRQQIFSLMSDIESLRRSVKLAKFFIKDNQDKLKYYNKDMRALKRELRKLQNDRTTN